MVSRSSWITLHTYSRIPLRAGCTCTQPSCVVLKHSCGTQTVVQDVHCCVGAPSNPGTQPALQPLVCIGLSLQHVQVGTSQPTVLHVRAHQQVLRPLLQQRPLLQPVSLGSCVGCQHSPPNGMLTCCTPPLQSFTFSALGLNRLDQAFSYLASSTQV
jgi:hypothetical protein